MANNNTIINSANTLSINSSPGQDILLGPTNSNSIFTFGSFQIETNTISDNIVANVGKSNFSNFSTLESFSSTTFDAFSVINTTENELNPKTNDPNSYAYFSSFYTKVAKAINDIIANFPYAILSNNFGTGFTAFNYLENDFARTSSFSIPISGLTNQGNVVFASGNTFGTTTSNTGNLYNNFNQFSIQFSGDTNNFSILDYSYTSGIAGYLQFTVNGLLLSSTTATTITAPIYIRPAPQAFGQYKRTISNLENQLLFDQYFLFPEPDSDTFVNQQFIFPKSIDGFNPDGSGPAFEAYSTTLLNNCTLVDDIKTNWMIRTMVPENYLELDTDDQIYTKLITTYAEEFDKVKEYVDNLAFMHSVNYKSQETVPDKFLYKLSSLLGFEFIDAFNDADIFEYLASEDDDEKTFKDYNLDLWKRMLTNLNWLYKKKGTRDAIMFIFKLIGAPDAIINFNEFVYTVNKRVNTDFNDKVNSDGYINYNASKFDFQESGTGRGSGQDYINQWEPEFTLNKQIDNIKIRTGDTITGTENILNTKQIELDIRPSSAIESDVKAWYAIGTSGTTVTGGTAGLWYWGSTGSTFSGLTVPYEWTVNNPDSIGAVSAMTIAEWTDFVYAQNVKPENRKTLGSGHNGDYISLKQIYLTYMLWTNNQVSNRLTFRRLEKFLTLLERNFFGYIPQLLPSTTILETEGTVYKNTVFNRQKFVYPKGLNDGSEFQREIPSLIEDDLAGFIVSSKVNDIIEDTLEGFVINSHVNEIINPVLTSTFVESTFILPNQLDFTSFAINSTLREEEQLTINKPNIFAGQPITFPTPTVLVMV